MQVQVLISRIVGIGVALVLAASFLPGQSGATRDIVYSEEGGQCLLTGSPSRAEARRNTVVVWHVTNRCSQSITVEVGNFKFNGQPREPLNSTGSATVASGKMGVIAAVIKDTAETGLYTYDVALEGGLPDDPELVINP